MTPGLTVGYNKTPDNKYELPKPAGFGSLFHQQSQWLFQMLFQTWAELRNLVTIHKKNSEFLRSTP
jgi:hypothetical protein